ncbi:ATP-dependent DNA helicase Q5 [Sarotherodon galilaeus]
MRAPGCFGSARGLSLRAWPRAKKAASGAKSGQDGGFIVGLQRALVLEDEDRGSRPSPRPKTLIWLASRPTKGPSWLGTTSGQEGRSWRLEVSAALMSVFLLTEESRGAEIPVNYGIDLNGERGSVSRVRLPFLFFLPFSTERLGERLEREK